MSHGTVEGQYAGHGIRPLAVGIGDGSGEVHHPPAFGQQSSALSGIVLQVVQGVPSGRQGRGKQFRIAAGQVDQVGRGQPVAAERTEETHFSQPLQLRQVLAVDEVEGIVTGHCHAQFSTDSRDGRTDRGGEEAGRQQPVDVDMAFNQVGSQGYLLFPFLSGLQGQSQVARRHLDVGRLGQVAETVHPDIVAGFFQVLEMAR